MNAKEISLMEGRDTGSLLCKREKGETPAAGTQVERLLLWFLPGVETL